MSGVVTVPAARGFVDVLAERLLADHGADPLALARVTVFLPTRRSVRALREALLRHRGGPVLLPAIHTLGDIDDDETWYLEHVSADSGADDPFGDADTGGRPMIAPLARQLLLAGQIRKWREAAGQRPVGAAQTLALAAELAWLLDRMQIARLDFSAFATLVPDDLAGHWREILDFLTIVTDHWPRILDERGEDDPIARRNRVVDALAEAWRREPPPWPVIAAGSTGSVPATADLLAVIARLPRGLVALPGLDTGIDDESWAAFDETHPQFGLKVLLERLEVAREDVPPWPQACPEPRAALTRELMRPGATVEAWRALGHIGAESIAGLERVDCPDEQAEAEIVALAMRRELETPGHTAALVTADRGLARRVRAELGRWSLSVDDSAGQPLAETAPGVFLRLTVAALAENLTPVPLLAMLKHPLACGGMKRLDFLSLARRLEHRCLRGPRPAPGFDGLRDGLGDEPPEELVEWLDGLAAAAGPLARLLADRRARPEPLIAGHRAFAEWLSSGEDHSAAVWEREAGRACRTLFDELARAAAGHASLSGSDYAALVDHALQRKSLRPARDEHPRLSIWGTLEARLQRADLLILGGLNEGSWPVEPEVDPWLSRPMRAQLGLPAPERRVGLSAHDFAQLFQAPRVMLTRAVKVQGTPSVPARWLTRLAAVLKGAGLELAKTPWLTWHHALDRPEDPPRPAAPPAPKPPVAARPRKLSVTRVEAWMRDPYEIYARHILRLRKLDPIDADPNAAEFGTALHEALDRFIRETPGDLPSDAHKRLLKIGEECLRRAQAPASLWEFWRSRFARVAGWFVDRDRERREAGIVSKTEIMGEMKIDAREGPFLLTAKADRLDRTPEGGIHIIDYKTGAPPGNREILAGYAPQLPLTGAILSEGGFPGFPAQAPAALSHWRLSGGDPPGLEVTPKKKGESDRYMSEQETAKALSEEALKGLRGRIAVYDSPDTPYCSRPALPHAPRFSDYEHLARVAEWSTAETAEDDTP